MVKNIVPTCYTKDTLFIHVIHNCNLAFYFTFYVPIWINFRKFITPTSSHCCVLCYCLWAANYDVPAVIILNPFFQSFDS